MTCEAMSEDQRSALIPFEDEYGVGTFMGTKSVIVEIIASVTLLVSGLYISYDATSNHSVNADAIVICGAVCLALGVLMLVFVGRSILSGRRIVRHIRGQ
jgi:choline-glycine betaine transporter